MATKSMLKNIEITDSKSAKALVIALERAYTTKGKEVKLSGSYRDIRGDKIKEILGIKS